MINTRLAKALAKSMDRIKHEDDRLPISIRGELEVIVKDREGNLLSYERGHNQVTDLAKMQIIHLLAGELYTIDADIYSTGVSGYKTFASTGSASDVVKNRIASNTTDPSTVHSTGLNADGTMVSGEQYFFNGNLLIGTGTQQQTIFLNQHNDIINTYNFPTKMLFGTGMEDHSKDTVLDTYRRLEASDIGAVLVNKVNGFTGSADLNNSFMNCLSTGSGYNFKTNYYSGNQYLCRTLQPTTTTPLTSVVDASQSAIDGAIKNCYITSVTDTAKYDASSRMAQGLYRGMGYPAYIYAQRKTAEFYNPDTDEFVHYNLDTDISSKYETELVYVVNMPAQPVNVEDISSFYPYNGWILKQAGLFSDSRFLLRSQGDGAATFNGITSANITSGNNPYYVNNASGTLLFKRNLSSPVLKTPDISITFAWHVFIVTN